MRGNHSSGRGSQSLGRGRGSQKIVRGGGIQQIFSGNNTTNVLPHSPTCTEDTLASPPLDTHVLSASDIPSPSHSAPACNVSSIPPILGGTSDATAASTTVGFSQSMSTMQTDDKIFIRPTLDNKQFIPSASRRIGKIFKEKLVEEGIKWSKVPSNMKEYYWEEFEKKYKWNPALLISVKDTWKHVASVRYNDKLGKWRKKYGKDAKPNSVPQEVWNKWWEYWNSEEFKALSQKASQNRRSEKAGEGSGPSKHIGGSKTTIQHSIDLEAELGRPPTPFEVFKRMHKKKDGSFVDKRSNDINEAVENMVAIASQLTDESTEAPKIDVAQIYLQAVGVEPKKRRVYGLGTHASTFYPDSVSSSSSASSHYNTLFDERLREELQEIQENLHRKNEEMQQKNEEMQKQIEEMKKKEEERLKREDEMQQKILHMEQIMCKLAQTSSIYQPPVQDPSRSPEVTTHTDSE